MVFLFSISQLLARYSFTPLEILAAVIAAKIHDVDHPGRNNAFLVTTGDELAIRYNDESVLENHHASTGFSILLQSDCNILSNLKREEYVELRKMVISLVLGTDFAKHFSILANFKAVMGGGEGGGGNSEAKEGGEPVSPETRLLVLKVSGRIMIHIVFYYSDFHLDRSQMC